MVAENICVICAMDVEYQNIKKYFNVQSQIMLNNKYEISVCNHPLCIIAKSGIGKKEAYNCLISILQVYPNIRQVLSVGIAGALFPYLSIGDIVMSNHIINYEENSYIEEIKSRWIHGECTQLDEITYYGKIVSSDVIVRSKEVKQKLYAMYQGMCVEMESAGLIGACNLRSIPFGAIKIISDYADEVSIYKIMKSQIRVCNKLGFSLQKIITKVADGT